MGMDLVRNLDQCTATLSGCGGPLPAGEFDLYLENAGTAVRSMTAALCLSQGSYRVDGNERMRERPIKDLTDALKPIGANIVHEINDGFLPLNIEANGLKGGYTEVQGGISSQYLTALLLAAPYAENDVHIKVIGTLTSKPYIDMTIKLMESFGVAVENNNFEEFKYSINFHTP